jgi:hydroxymethylglutaryl-CoA lyase
MPASNAAALRSATVVVLRDVTLRDGLQDEAPVTTAVKLGLFDALVTAGIRDLELT